MCIRRTCHISGSRRPFDTLTSALDRKFRDTSIEHGFTPNFIPNKTVFKTKNGFPDPEKKLKFEWESLKIIKPIEISETNQYQNSYCHPDSILKVEFYISKIATNAKQRKKVLLTPKIPKVSNHRKSRFSNFGRLRIQTGAPNSYFREKSRPVFWGLS